MSNKPLGGLARLGLNAIGLYVALVVFVIVFSIVGTIASELGIFFIPVLGLILYAWINRRTLLARLPKRQASNRPRPTVTIPEE